MPEGDSVWRAARRLHEALAGEPLTSCDLRRASTATVDLRGRTTIEVVSRGKHILHRVEGGITVHSHLRMDGRWLVRPATAVTARTLADHRLRAVVGTRRWTCLGHDLGMLDVVRTDREDRIVGHLGPDLLGSDWDLDEAVRRLMSAPDRTIGEALLDQRNLAGIGTMWAAESLFLERIHPWASVGELGPEAVGAIVSRARRLIDRARRSPVPTSTGSTRAGTALYVHARSGRPCRRCGDTVRVAMIGQAPQDRTMFSCPTCQGGIGPTDDGRPQGPLGSGPRARPGAGRH